MESWAVSKAGGWPRRSVWSHVHCFSWPSLAPPYSQPNIAPAQRFTSVLLNVLSSLSSRARIPSPLTFPLPLPASVRAAGWYLVRVRVLQAQVYCKFTCLHPSVMGTSMSHSVPVKLDLSTSCRCTVHFYMLMMWHRVANSCLHCRLCRQCRGSHVVLNCPCNEY